VCNRHAGNNRYCKCSLTDAVEGGEGHNPGHPQLLVVGAHRAPTTALRSLPGACRERRGRGPHCPTVASCFFADAVLPTGAAFFAIFLATPFFATAPLVTDDFGLPALLAVLVPVATASAPAIENLDRSLAAASQAGAGPRPLHVAPVLGSRYFAGCGPLRCPL